VSTASGSEHGPESVPRAVASAAPEQAVYKSRSLPLAVLTQSSSSRGTDSVFIIPFIKVRQFIALTIDHVVNRTGYAFFSPQVARTAMPRPGFDPALPGAGLDHLPRGIGFEGVHHRLRFASCCHDAVNVIGSHVDCPQHPASLITVLAHAFFHRRSAHCGQFNRITLHTRAQFASPLLVRRKHWCSVNVVRTIGRASFIAMQPRAVTTKRDEICQWDSAFIEFRLLMLHSILRSAPRDESGRVSTASGSERGSISRPSDRATLATARGTDSGSAPSPCKRTFERVSPRRFRRCRRYPSNLRRRCPRRKTDPACARPSRSSTRPQAYRAAG